ncbi:twin-arginine translocase subunit TatC [Bartonella quintana]|uniref:Sec-independent protein translocase protein TatC n=3 Tax=Bartonella quintana TaxID=803 RepID=A0A0H3LTV6_BARQU|nr:twin-arginine translocase subunit TatC [Bartonella quintana]ETS11628.1 twin arginine-targeting protein translocase TatC [Bartonella quintana BQ2-D70]ETS14435.1 twin arginine-targeting protein translocase TatC [Bartonella quintana JK 73rel]ETS16121.1 twin arginine-targeting protein translocase TatC [Bartonella quintana JK 73]ETS18124.1 twin arginine-targeting protein translocase TatC [Bartonella quintana JK 7]ETS18953.1 twin arginine-targeting protein translocase TatC [Bartonella quintana JK
MNERDEVDANMAPLLEHLIELRQRIIVALIAFLIAFMMCFLVKDYILNFLIWPYQWAMKMSGGNPESIRLQSTQVWETFLTKMKLAAFGAAILSFPCTAFQFYSFIAPGLYKNERMAFLPFLISSPILFCIGGAFVYALLAPIMLWFSLSQQFLPGVHLRIEFIVRISDYLSFMTSFMLIFGLIFQLPLVTSLLTNVGLLTSHGLVSKRKWAILVSFIIAAIVTPSDFFTMFAVALPTIALYEISILIAYWIEKRKNPLKRSL